MKLYKKVFIVLNFNFVSYHTHIKKYFQFIICNKMIILRFILSDCNKAIGSEFRTQSLFLEPSKGIPEEGHIF